MSMIVGTLEVKLYVRFSQSLKEKRKVIKSVKDRINHKFNVSIAEVDHENSRQQSTLGIAMVANDSKHLTSCLTKVINHIRTVRDAELLDYHIDTLYPDDY